MTTRVGKCCCGLSKIGALEVIPASAILTGIQEVWMVKQIEEVGIETEACPLADFETLADSKINVCEHRAWQGTTAHIGIAPEAAVGIERRIRQAIR